MLLNLGIVFVQVLPEVSRRDRTGAGPFLEEVLRVVKDFVTNKFQEGAG